MRGMRRSRAVLGALLLAAVACERGPGANEGYAVGDGAAPKKKWFVAASIDRLSNDYFAKIKQGVEARAKELGLEVSVQDARGDDATQLQQIESFIRQKVDALIVAAVNDDVPAIEEAVTRARAAGIKVVAQSQRVKTADVYVSIRQHDYGEVGGEMAGAWIRDHRKGKAVVGLIGNPERPTIAERVQGLKDGVKKLAPDAQIDVTIAAPNPEKARSNTEAALQQHPDLAVLVSFNDENAIAAANAILAKAGSDAAKAKERYAVFGLDAIPAALDALRDPASPFRGTVDIDPFGNGKVDVDCAVALLEGKPVAGAVGGAGGQLYLPVAMKPITPDAEPAKK